MSVVCNCIVCNKAYADGESDDRQDDDWVPPYKQNQDNDWLHNGTYGQSKPVERVSILDVRDRLYYLRDLVSVCGEALIGKGAEQEIVRNEIYNVMFFYVDGEARKIK